MKRFALASQHCFLMRGIEHKLSAIVAARVARDLVRAVENAHRDVGGDQRQLPSHCLWRNRIPVEIETDVNGCLHPASELPRAGWGAKTKMAAERNPNFETIGAGWRDQPPAGDL